jgi:hypothetical protein
MAAKKRAIDKTPLMFRKVEQKKLAYIMLGFVGVMLLLGIILKAAFPLGYQVNVLDEGVKNARLKSLDELNAKIYPQGRLAYSGTEDKGCEQHLEVWGRVSPVVCRGVSYKVYVGVEPRNENIKGLDISLTQLGFSRVESSYSELLSGKPFHNSLIYTQPGADVADVTAFFQTGKSAPYQIRELEDSGKIPKVSESEYYFGVVMQSSYFSCTINCDYPGK